MKFERKDGYASGLERAVCMDLKKRRVKFEYEPDRLKYPRRVPGAKCEACSGPASRVSVYTPDIKLRKDGSYIEVKGRFTSANRQRMADFKKGRPDVQVRILFAADNWCTKTKRQRYTDWAKAHGYVCAVGKSVPDQWLQ